MVQVGFGAVMLETIQGLDLRWPVVSPAAREANARARRVLDDERPTSEPAPSADAHDYKVPLGG
ncbi:hypothetical protein [Jiangella alkaliphila]|uniref:Uncharacterized protein n=1 Tax=Jiangella alkaliphila TaxID=419479 RepID=A0A1H2KLF3_9ACTN|nr:hypothetical protein [Jiangella alkaliphila]SDU69268.1 hypothetical protein SAMN04488563_3952 [Jiangella alkaliphila]